MLNGVHLEHQESCTHYMVLLQAVDKPALLAELILNGNIQYVKPI